MVYASEADGDLIMDRDTLRKIRFFCAGAIVVASIAQLLVPGSTPGAVAASLMGGMIGLAASRRAVPV